MIEHLNPKEQARELIQVLNDITAECFGKDVPLEETIERFQKADHLFLVIPASEIIGYALNDELHLVVEGGIVKVNYWGSGFILPEYRGQGLYNRLNKERVEAIPFASVIMTRTQCPPVAVDFRRVCVQYGFEVVPAEDGSIDGRALLIARAQFPSCTATLHCPKVYGRELMDKTPEPEGYAKIALADVDPKRGDARVLVGIRG
ncbi:MAG TPA: hypothetical protein VJH22_06515 [Candidatus Nanoarchaeia archaeon]|nr:hypothetical protein [Candidatus Nanoarchaeia archaeon]